MSEPESVESDAHNWSMRLVLLGGGFAEVEVTDEQRQWQVHQIMMPDVRLLRLMCDGRDVHIFKHAIVMVEFVKAD